MPTITPKHKKTPTINTTFKPTTAQPHPRPTKKVLTGASLGGAVAVDFAHAHPEAVEKLVGECVVAFCVIGLLLIWWLAMSVDGMIVGRYDTKTDCERL